MTLLAVLFFGLWITGMATSHTMGGFIHVLLIMGIVIFINGMIRGNHSTKLPELRASSSESHER